MRICFARGLMCSRARMPELEQWIEKIGARLVKLDAAEHDRLVALVSHLPQLLSTALASLIADQPGGGAGGRTGGGGSDAAGAQPVRHLARYFFDQRRGDRSRC